MRFTTAAFVISAMSIWMARAIDISGAPACAQTCLEDNLDQTTCDPEATDATCFCADTNYYNIVAECVIGACSTADVLATLTWYGETC